MASPEAEPAAGKESTATTAPKALPAEPQLPKLSAADFRRYNYQADHMDAYHNHFRYIWNILYKTCTTGSRPAGMSLRNFIFQGLQLCRQLTSHHRFEEAYVFPVLAERMPEFAENEQLLAQHELIHQGLVRLEDYLDECRGGERELRLEELKEVLDSFGTVLWTHLDDEVRTLGAENMRKYWSMDDIEAMPW